MYNIIIVLIIFSWRVQQWAQIATLFSREIFPTSRDLPAAIARTYYNVYNTDYSIARAEVHFSVARAFIVVGNSLSPL